MYEYLQGMVAELTPAYTVIEAGGVGYYVNISLQTYSELEGSESARVYLHYIVREDAQIFYGFSTKQERDVFRLLISVSGVGGNTARMILSTYSAAELTNIIAAENAVQLKNVKGLGLKTAQKIIVELKDKIVGTGSSLASAAGLQAHVSGEIYAEALAALTMLGFSRAASDKVLRGVIAANAGAGVEEVIRLSLKKL